MGISFPQTRGESIRLNCDCHYTSEWNELRVKWHNFQQTLLTENHCFFSDANEDDSNSSIVSMDDFDRKEQKRPSFYHNSVAAAAEPPPYDESLDDEEKSSDKAERL